MATITSAKGFTIRDVPGIIYDPLDDRARVVGTGLEVFEIMQVALGVGGDWDRLRRVFHWLRDDRLRAALAFAELNAEFVSARIKEGEDLERNIEQLWPDSPITSPPWR